jgi:hypothetical protein
MKQNVDGVEKRKSGDAGAEFAEKSEEALR